VRSKIPSAIFLQSAEPASVDSTLVREWVPGYTTLMMNLGNRLKAHALDLGFDLVGIARAASAEGADALHAWLEAGMHGSMDFMRRNEELRGDPRLLLSDCRSILAVAMSYHSSSAPSMEINGEECWISSYAWGRDYHHVMKKKLIRLGRWLENETGCSWRATVDTAPVLEREWAARAGLGWIGKNTMLINRKFGSELFLGLLLNTLPLEPDTPSGEHCGKCTACLEACPTDAFAAPRVLNAEKCIAYLTIEHEGDIHIEQAEKMERHLAGCDRCNEVCPFNRNAPTDLHPEYLPRPGLYRPKLKDIQALDEDGWRRLRQGSPLNRISYPRLRRTLKVLTQSRDFGDNEGGEVDGEGG